MLARSSSWPLMSRPVKVCSDSSDDYRSVMSTHEPIKSQKVPSASNRGAKIHHPAVHSIEAAQAVFYLKVNPRVERAGVDCAQHRTGSSGCTPAVQPCPSSSAWSGELQPTLIEKCAKFLCAGHPDRHRSRVGDQAKTVFAFPGGFVRLACAR